MKPIVITCATMLVITLILSLAMAVAWASFGRPRHALSWSVAYLLYGIKILLFITEVSIPASRTITQPLTLACVLSPAVLVAIGARLRAGLPSWTRELGIAAILTFAVSEAARLLPFPLPWLSTISGLFTAAMLMIALVAIRPRDRRPEPAERVAIGALAVFAAFELFLVAADLLAQADPAAEGRRIFLDDLHLTGLTPVFVANGVAAILLLASDLGARLRMLASHDPLTGILNRRGFHEAALRAIANGRRQRQSIAVAIADIDHFKSINDRFGHTAGDRTLHHICGHLASGLRAEDLVGRIGGEEFALLLVNSTAAQAMQAMERIRIEVGTGFSNDGIPVSVTISFGVAPVALGTGNTETAMAAALDEADRALYRSKVEGRNRTTLADAA